MDPIADFAAARMAGSPSVLSCGRIATGYANVNYRLETSSGVFLLRDRNNHSLQQVEFELDVLDWLQDHGFPAPPVASFAGGERWIAGPEGGPLVLLDWLEGSEPVTSKESVTAVARALADLHRLPLPRGEWWKRENPIGQQAGHDLVGVIGSQDSELFHFFRDEFVSLGAHLDEALPRGLIHGDIFTDNTLFLGDQLVAILDFDEACEDVLLFDVAMTIHGFCYTDEQWKPDLAHDFLAAYEETRPLTTEERDALPLYLRWCPLATMGWHLEQLKRRPDASNEKRAMELALRVATMKAEPWSPAS